MNLAFPLIPQEENSTQPKPYSNVCLPGLLICHNFSPTSRYSTRSSSTCQLNLPSTRTCFGQWPSVLLVPPCGCLSRRTSEHAKTLGPFRLLARPSLNSKNIHDYFYYYQLQYQLYTTTTNQSLSYISFEVYYFYSAYLYFCFVSLGATKAPFTLAKWVETDFS